MNLLLLYFFIIY